MPRYAIGEYFRCIKCNGILGKVLPTGELEIKANNMEEYIKLTQGKIRCERPKNYRNRSDICGAEYDIRGVQLPADNANIIVKLIGE